MTNGVGRWCNKASRQHIPDVCNIISHPKYRPRNNKIGKILEHSGITLTTQSVKENLNEIFYWNRFINAILTSKRPAKTIVKERKHLINYVVVSKIQQNNTTLLKF